MAIVAINAVRKDYGGVPVIHGVTVDMRDGAFLTLAGPSGSDKSTLLRMIAGLEDITGWEIQIGGHTVNDARPKERDIAVVFQNYALSRQMFSASICSANVTAAAFPMH